MHLASADRQVGRKAPPQSAQTWCSNFEEVTIKGDYEVTFRLKRPQPSRYWRCWPPAGRRSTPVTSRRATCGRIRSAPARLNSSNSDQAVARNPKYCKPDLPYLDGIEWPIVPSLATRILGFVAAVSIRFSA